jgi:hypothetical protein
MTGPMGFLAVSAIAPTLDLPDRILHNGFLQDSIEETEEVVGQGLSTPWSVPATTFSAPSLPTSLAKIVFPQLGDVVSDTEENAT